MNLKKIIISKDLLYCKRGFIYRILPNPSIFDGFFFCTRHFTKFKCYLIFLQIYLTSILEERREDEEKNAATQKNSVTIWGLERSKR